VKSAKIVAAGQMSKQRSRISRAMVVVSLSSG
jgi:hypothetical protein